MSLPESSDRQESRLIIALGFVQGLALFAMTNAGMVNWGEEHTWLYRTLWGWALFLPPSAQWLISHRHRRAYWLVLALIAVLVPLICFEPARAIVPQSPEPFEGVLVLGGLLAWAAIISLASAALSRGGVRDYPGLFRLACRTALLPAGAVLFTLIFTLLLWLWGALFNLIQIDFFKRLFELDWFIWPLRGIVFGVATAILIERPALVDGVRRACTAIASALLPVIVVIHLLFLAGLAFAGLGPLWATRHATPLVLALLGAFFILLNGTHEDGTKLDGQARPFAVLTRVAILLSPIYVAIAAYSLGLRVAQYGWSPDRVVSACIIGFAGVVALMYFIAAVRGPFLTLPRLALPNVIALAILPVICIAINSPLLSPLRIAAVSQEARILDGRVALNKIDWGHLAFDLGRYGRAALDRLAVAKGFANEETIRSNATTALATETLGRYELNRKLRGEDVPPALALTVLPADAAIPTELADALRFRLKWRLPTTCSDSCTLLAVDLNNDGTREFVTLAGALPVFFLDQGTWSYLGDYHAYAGDGSALIAALSGGKGRAVPAEWQDLDVDGVRLRLRRD